jgi:hypothetical protein
MVIDIVMLVSAVLGLVAIVVRAVESIYQLSQTPGLNTIGKCIQVVKNFFKIERYVKS